MRDEGVTSGTAIIFWPHGGSREPDETIAPSYQAERQTPSLYEPRTPGLIPWVAHERFAPSGPGFATLPTIRLELPLFGATAFYPAPPPELPEALLDEPAVLEHIAALVEVAAPDPADATDVDDSADQLEMADQELDEVEGDTAPHDWVPPEPNEPSLDVLPPPYWGTTTDPARNAELTEGHGYPVEPVQPELPPLPPAEDEASALAPPPEPRPGLLSWLDRGLRRRREQEPEPVVEPELVGFAAAEAIPDESPVVDDAPHGSRAEPPPALVENPVAVEPPRASQTEPQLLAPEPLPQPVEPPASAEIPLVIEPPAEHQTEPEFLAPEPPAQPVEPPAPAEIPLVIEPPAEHQTEPELPAPEPPPHPVAPAEIPVVVEPPRESQAEPLVSAPEPTGADGRRSRRIEPRLSKRRHIPSLFAPSTAPLPAPAVDKAPRSRRFGWRMWRRPPVPTANVALFPVEAPVADEAHETHTVQPPAPVEPTPPIDTPLDDVRHEPQDLPVEATPEPPPPHAPPAEEIAPEPHAPAPSEARNEPAPPIQPAAYWAEPNWAKPAQTTADQPESLAWTPPPNPAAGAPGTRRTTPAMDGLWETEPVGAPSAGSLSQDGSRRRVVRRVATIGGGVVVLAAASVAVFHFLPRAFVSKLVPAATFNAPMMVLRANGPGRVVSVAVQNGQAVDPTTLLLTIRTEPQPDPAAALLRARLDAAQAHLAELDQSLAQTTPATDAGRARIADLRRQRAAAVIDVAQLQDGVTNIPAPKPNDLPVKAGVHGVIRSLEARNGTTTAAGVPLVRMLDCDHAFLTVPPDSKLHAGEAVQVRLPNLPPVAATVRQSSGIAEPPDSLVIATQPGAFVGQLSGSCPIGATATVTPSMTGS